MKTRTRRLQYLQQKRQQQQQIISDCTEMYKKSSDVSLVNHENIIMRDFCHYSLQFFSFYFPSMNKLL